MIRFLSLLGKPPVSGAPDEIDWHGLPTASSIVAPDGDPVTIGLEDLEHVPDPMGRPLVVAVSPGVIRVGKQFLWVPEGALIRPPGAVPPQHLIASWRAFTSCIVALEAGTLRCDAPLNSEHDRYTGLTTARTLASGYIAIVRADLHVQTNLVPAGASIWVTPNAECSAGSLLASWPSHERGQFPLAEPLNPRSELAQDWISEGIPEQGDAHAGERWGRIVKLVGDAPTEVWRVLPAEARTVLTSIATRPREFATSYIQHRFCNEQDARAEARAYRRFLRGLTALDRIVQARD